MSYLSRLIDWIKANKLASIFILVVLYFLFANSLRSQISYKSNMMSQTLNTSSAGAGESFGRASATDSFAKDSMPIAPQPVSSNSTPPNVARLTIQNYNFSLLVNEIKPAIDQIKNKVMSVGGFVIDSQIINPSGYSSASISMRVPREKADETVEFLRKLATEVKAENSSGTDVTDQFYDIEARLAVLNENKTRFQEIMRRATAVADILSVQKEIIGLQDQIDALQGQKKYIDEASKFTRITANLAVKDSALPTNPNASWSIGGVFLEAFGVLVGILIALGTVAIYILVFGIIWIPALIIYKIIKRRKKTI